MSLSWDRVAIELRRMVAEDASKQREAQHLDEGQRASLSWMSGRIPQSGVVLADEVGTGKTRIACAGDKSDRHQKQRRTREVADCRSSMLGHASQCTPDVHK